MRFIFLFSFRVKAKLLRSIIALLHRYNVQFRFCWLLFMLYNISFNFIHITQKKNSIFARIIFAPILHILFFVIQFGCALRTYNEYKGRLRAYAYCSTQYKDTWYIAIYSIYNNTHFYKFDNNNWMISHPKHFDTHTSPITQCVNVKWKKRNLYRRILLVYICM